MTITSTGSSQVVFWCDIHGCPYVFDTANKTTTDSWYADRTGTTLKPYLDYSGITLDESADFAEGTCNVEGLEITILDVDEEITALLKSGIAGAFTRITEDHANDDTTITVDSTANFAASGVIYIGQEAIAYDELGDPGPSFDTCTRGYYNSEAKAYDVDLTVSPARLPIVRDGFLPLAGRRVDIYKGEVDSNGDLLTIDGAETECIYRGIIGAQAEIGEGQITLSVESIFARWGESVGDKTFSGSVYPGYFYKGLLTGHTEGDGYGLSTIPVTTNESGTVETYYATVDETYYPSYHDLANDLAGHFTTALAVPEISAQIMYVGDKYNLLWKAHGAADSYKLTWRVTEGDPLWALGFEADDYSGEVATGVDLEVSADNSPQAFVMEVASDIGDELNPYCMVPDESQFVDDTWVLIGKEPAQCLRVADTATSNTLKFSVNPWEGDPVNSDWSKGYVAVEDEEDLTLRQVFACLDDTLKEAMQRCLGLLSGQDEPARWCIQGIESGDIDWTELDDALIGASTPMKQVYYVVSEPESFQDIFCDRLGVLGIAPRLTDDSKIGFVRISDPVELNAHTVELDSSVWEYFGAAHIRAQLEGQQYLTRIELTHSINWNGDKNPPPVSLHYSNITNELGSVFTLSYELKGVWCTPHYGTDTFDSVTALATELSNSLFGTHMQWYGGTCPIVPIPVIHTAKQYKVGDIVQITHDTLPDVAEGARGVTDRLGLICHRTQQWTEESPDVIYVMLPATCFARPIAPCALATGWTQATKVLAFADTDLYAQSGATDLDEFEAGMDVKFTDYDSTTPSTYSGTIASVDTGAKTMTLTTDVFGANNSDEVWVHWPEWDDSDGDQQKWLYVADTSYGLGATPDDGAQWGA